MVALKVVPPSGVNKKKKNSQQNTVRESACMANGTLGMERDCLFGIQKLLLVLFWRKSCLFFFESRTVQDCKLRIRVDC